MPRGTVKCFRFADSTDLSIHQIDCVQLAETEEAEMSAIWRPERGPCPVRSLQLCHTTGGQISNPDCFAAVSVCRNEREAPSVWRYRKMVWQERLVRWRK